MKLQTIIASSNRVQSQLCLSAAAIAGAAIGCANTASATVVTTFQNANIAVPASLAGIYIDLASGATGGASFAGWDFNPYQTASGLGFYWGTDLAGGLRGGAVEQSLNVSADLPLGTVVSAASVFTSAIQSANPNYRDTGISYLGFRFVNGATMNFGYAAIQTTAGAGNGNGFPATILGWRYEDSGGPITVTAIPAPGATGLLAVLAAGAVSRRTRRNAA